MTRHEMLTMAVGTTILTNVTDGLMASAYALIAIVAWCVVAIDLIGHRQ